MANRSRGKGNGRRGFSSSRRESFASSALTEYFRDVGRYEPMDRDAEREVARRARRGDREALQQLVQANLRFVVSVAKKYRGRGLPLTDLVQAGNLGMVTAAMKFDPERGVKFISYAVWWVRQAIQSALAHQGRSVRLPMNRASEMAKILKAGRMLREGLGRDPTAEEIARETGIRAETVELLTTLHTGEVRLDVPIGDEERSTVGERLVVEEDSSITAAVEEGLMRDEIDAALKTLRERDALVLRLYYGLDGERGRTLREIGERLGISRERVRQLRDRALAELREGDRAEALASFAA